MGGTALVMRKLSLEIQMKWSDKKQVKKGKIGEQIVIDWLISKGIIPYKPVLGTGAHPFDQLCATKDKSKIFITECKAKPARIYYPDTGINISHHQDYKNIQEKYGIDVFIYFIDEDAQKIYGGSLDTISEEIVINHRGKSIKYPLTQKGIIYFPLENMNKIADISDAKAEQLRQYSSRNPSYKKERK